MMKEAKLHDALNDFVENSSPISMQTRQREAVEAVIAAKAVTTGVKVVIAAKAVNAVMLRLFIVQIRIAPQSV
jgi:hypothetical protein